MLRFWGIHVLTFIGAAWHGPTAQAVIAGVAVYCLLMFGITAGYHRYFSHRSFKTSRAGVAVLAFIAQCSGQQGVLWWGSHHRKHHRYSDQERDVHSPVQRGWLYSHVGWVWNPENQPTDFDGIKDLASFPELRWLNRYWVLPPVLLATFCGLTLGWSGLFWSYGLATVAAWHATFCVNSVCHLWGSKPFDTGDDSRNNWFVALIAFGEGWHNNHHHYQSSARQGFAWWQLDITYVLLRLLAVVGLVWDVREPPAELMGAQNT